MEAGRLYKADSIKGTRKRCLCLIFSGCLSYINKLASCVWISNVCAMNQENIKRARFQSIVRVLWCLHVFNQTGIKSYCLSACNFTALTSNAAALLLECYRVLTGETVVKHFRERLNERQRPCIISGHEEPIDVWESNTVWLLSEGAAWAAQGLDWCYAADSPPPPPHLACETALPHNSILVSASGGDAVVFSFRVFVLCRLLFGSASLWAKHGAGVVFSPQYSFSALFLCKRNFLQGGNMVGEDIILVGKSSLLMF